MKEPEYALFKISTYLGKMSLSPRPKVARKILMRGPKSVILRALEEISLKSEHQSTDTLNIQIVARKYTGQKEETNSYRPHEKQHRRS